MRAANKAAMRRKAGRDASLLCLQLIKNKNPALKTFRAGFCIGQQLGEEVRGVEPRSEMVYRSSLYVCSFQIKIRQQKRLETNNCKLFCKNFT